jgi:hypothetical protein
MSRESRPPDDTPPTRSRLEEQLRALVRQWRTDLRKADARKRLRLVTQHADDLEHVLDTVRLSPEEADLYKVIVR